MSGLYYAPFDDVELLKNGHFKMKTGKESVWSLEDVKYIKHYVDIGEDSPSKLAEQSEISFYTISRIISSLKEGIFDEYLYDEVEFDNKSDANIVIHDGVHIEIHNHHEPVNDKVEVKKIKLNQGTLKRWSKRVRERDGYICRACGHQNQSNKGTNTIEAHHLYPKSKHPVLAYDEGNGVALCQKCHKQYHNMYNGCETPQNFLRWVDDYKRRGY